LRDTKFLSPRAPELIDPITGSLLRKYEANYYFKSSNEINYENPIVAFEHVPGASQGVIPYWLDGSSGSKLSWDTKLSKQLTKEKVNIAQWMT